MGIGHVKLDDSDVPEKVQFIGASEEQAVCALVVLERFSVTVRINKLCPVQIRRHMERLMDV